MEQNGVIETLSSPWITPVVLVKKKYDSTMFCVDYRKLNDITKKIVEIAEKDKKKTAFSASDGLWQFKVMPNAPATFERLMERVLKGLHWKTCLVYLDDIIKEVKYLGHRVTAAGISTDEDKIRAVKDWPRPQNLHELRSFLGLCTTIDASYLTSLLWLHELTKKSRAYRWTEWSEKNLCWIPTLVGTELEECFHKWSMAWKRWLLQFKIQRCNLLVGLSVCRAIILALSTERCETQQRRCSLQATMRFECRHCVQAEKKEHVVDVRLMHLDSGEELLSDTKKRHNPVKNYVGEGS
ncbi:Retrovirus-related Pol polyprotein from transposon 17.6 [Eumeta japonica]|uniref:Retrovirus-related Pol polyprotein from transposon 17.6 n=1 Tax=Eumeta variegata TaxID=151549 RepID=A0A4C1TDF2_EUMVA|nr:Retrovirus-related Pol polyprotein from transposon 17.6 [Eumeta japonica]